MDSCGPPPLNRVMACHPLTPSLPSPEGRPSSSRAWGGGAKQLPDGKTNQRPPQRKDKHNDAWAQGGMWLSQSGCRHRVRPLTPLHTPPSRRSLAALRLWTWATLRMAVGRSAVASRALATKLAAAEPSASLLVASCSNLGVRIRIRLDQLERAAIHPRCFVPLLAFFLRHRRSDDSLCPSDLGRVLTSVPTCRLVGVGMNDWRTQKNATKIFTPGVLLFFQICHSIAKAERPFSNAGV
ncbi:hypothetical protein DFJ73DRAFT_340949 [Zopfochytrium polystomum]|nr:hypothetical protein DFJ73DRAFT_340949 [Zopfochytrium polystomum]